MFLPSPWPSGRPAPRLSSYSAALLRETQSRPSSCLIALSRSTSDPLIVSCFMLCMARLIKGITMRHIAGCIVVGQLGSLGESLTWASDAI